METKYYSMKETAERLRLSRAFVYYLKDTGKLKVEKIGNQYVVSQKAIEEYQNNHNDQRLKPKARQEVTQRGQKGL